MDGVVQLGPLALATDRLLAVALILVFVTAMDRIALRAGAHSTRATGFALFGGAVAARLGYIVTHWDAYAQDWGSAFAFWQGGFSVWAGVLVAGAIIAWRMKPRPAMLKGLVLLAALTAAWFAGWALLKPEPRPLPPLPALETVDGAAIAPQDLSGKPLVINLWATWCPPCRRELPMLAQVADQAGIPVLLVNQGEDAATVSTYLQQQGIPARHIVLDRSGALSRSLDSQVLPTTLFVDRAGNITELHIGEISRAALLSRIGQLEGE